MDSTIGMRLLAQVRPIIHETQTRQEEYTVLSSCIFVCGEMEGKPAWLSSQKMICKLQSLEVMM